MPLDLSMADPEAMEAAADSRAREAQTNGDDVVPVFSANSKGSSDDPLGCVKGPYGERLCKGRLVVCMDGACKEKRSEQADGLG